MQVSSRSRTIWVEADYPVVTRRGLASLGLKVVEGVKRASVTAVALRDGRLLGGSDPRKYGAAMGCCEGPLPPDGMPSKAAASGAAR